MVEETDVKTEAGAETQDDYEKDPYEEQGDSETSGDSSSQKTEGQKDEGTPAEGDKTVTQPQKDGEPAEGQAVPYPRFKEINDAKNVLTEENRRIQSELEGIRDQLQKPDVLRALAAEMDKENKDPDFKLDTPEGWKEMVRHEARKAKEEVAEQVTKLQVSMYLDKQENEARKLAQDVYKLDFGQNGQDESNPATAVGKMTSYINRHPEDANLGYVKILKLAMAEEALGLGEQQGVLKERQRHEKLKQGAMEGGTQTSKGDEPGSDWPISRLLEWSRTHNK